MKKLLWTVSVLTILSSCATNKIIPIKGVYPQTPIEISSEKSFDECWSKLVDLFAQKGFSIKVIDRSSGLIISDKGLMKTTIEDNAGKLMDVSAWIVVPKQRNAASRRDEPISGTLSGAYAKNIVAKDVSGEWNVRIKTVNSKTIINVNIVNVAYEDYISNGMGRGGYYKDVSLYSYKSTGVFENIVSDIIK